MQLSKPCLALLTPCPLLYASTTSVILPIGRRRNYAIHASPPPGVGAGTGTTPEDGQQSQQQQLHIPWPILPSTTRITPYDIFACKKTSFTYSKQTFYHLVKQYHPDRPISHHQHGLTKEQRMERFRLVVAANDILCDPIKKNAYDRYGAGWSGMEGVRHNNNETNRNWRDGRTWKTRKADEVKKTGWAGWADKFSHRHAHSHFDDSPAGNATWEDWERWYRRDEPIIRHPLTTNTNFITMVVLFAFVGGLMQVNRLDTNAVSLVEGRERQHTKLSKDMTRLERETVLAGSRQERIQAFMDSRDPAMQIPLATTPEEKPLLFPLPREERE